VTTSTEPDRGEYFSAWEPPRRARFTVVCLALTVIGLVASKLDRSVVEALSLNGLYVANNPWRIVSYVIPHAEFWHWIRCAILITVYGLLLEPRVGPRTIVPTVLAASRVNS